MLGPNPHYIVCFLMHLLCPLFVILFCQENHISIKTTPRKRILNNFVYNQQFSEYFNVNSESKRIQTRLSPKYVGFASSNPINCLTHDMVLFGALPTNESGQSIVNLRIVCPLCYIVEYNFIKKYVQEKIKLSILRTEFDQNDKFSFNQEIF